MEPTAREPVTLLLHGAASVRALELTLDGILGQTNPHFSLLAGRRESGPEGAALFARYGDPRMKLLADEAACIATVSAGVAGIVPAATLFLPTWLSRLAATLHRTPNADIVLCQGTLYDGTRLCPDEPLPADSAALLKALTLRPELAEGALFRTSCIPPGSASIAELMACFTPAQAALVPQRLRLRRIAGPAPVSQRRLPTQLFGRQYLPADTEADRPPTLFVVVDTEAEFDWAEPFSPNLTAVSALSQVEDAQAIFDRYGLRPVYLIDYPVASQPQGVAPIRAILDRDAAVLGAHLHPWTNPPLDEPIDRRLSFPGNLAAGAEAAKLDALLDAIEQNFGERPVFYKAGRYGIGPNTASTIASRGAKVDFSLLPETDLRDRHGPDFRMVNAIPYYVEGLDLLAVPMTRADVGPLSRWWRLRGWLDTQTAAFLHMRALLVRAGLLERLTLTPEGVDARLQIVLLQTLLRRGHRLFVLHFHSPSLAAGHTPYVRTESDRREFLSRIDRVCKWFFEDLGGVPGHPWDLLTIERRAGRRKQSSTVNIH